MAIPDHIKKIITTIPGSAGIYQYYDKNRSLLYVGKAKNLKKRISSYFTKTHEHARIRVLVGKIQEIKCVLVTTEIDALLLENNLIKKHQPKYNVMLKDGKTYPWICISNEKVPRIFQTRDVMKSEGEYFGPYVSTHMVKTLLNVCSDLFYSYGWTPISYINRTVKSKKDLANYLSIINDIRNILNGNLYSLINDLRKRMRLYAKNLQFEKAQIEKEKISILKKYQSKSIIVSPKINNVDVFTIVSDENTGFVNFLKITSGAIIQTHALELRKQLNEKEEELLRLAIVELRQKFNSTSKEIYCSHTIKNTWEGLKITVPKIGDKKKLINLSLQNAKYMLLDKKKKKINRVERLENKHVLKKLQKDLRLKDLPINIECFDNSNLQGTDAVAACVVFKNAKPSKKDYRHFNIKTVVGPDDFASMEEVVYRRYNRILKEEKTLPNLIIIDGGKGQLSAAVKSLEKLRLRGMVPVIGIAKRLEEIYFPNDSVPLYLDKRSESLKLIQRLRNEAHRFGITHHRKKRSQNYLSTSLDKIDGIGMKTISLLISHFGSIKKVNSATKKDLIQLIGKNKTDKIFQFKQSK
jgi:excinuclease ABC subunit C